MVWATSVDHTVGSDDARRSRWSAILEQRCPRCRAGEIFSGILSTRERCPICNLVYEREHGYFTGAMVVSYAVAVPLLALLILLVWLAIRSVEWALVIADVLFLPLAPVVFRYSRVIWMHFDRALDPGTD